MTVTFFGHSNTSQSIQPLLYSVLQKLIENDGASLFYIGNHGNFDSIAVNTLKNLKSYYPHIRYYIVLAYMPTPNKVYDYSETIFPECLESTPSRYAIIKRNEWMIKQSDVIITYAHNITGGAIRFKNLSEKKGKRVINLPFQ